MTEPEEVPFFVVILGKFHMYMCIFKNDVFQQ